MQLRACLLVKAKMQTQIQHMCASGVSAPFRDGRCKLDVAVDEEAISPGTNTCRSILLIHIIPETPNIYIYSSFEVMTCFIYYIMYRWLYSRLPKFTNKELHGNLQDVYVSRHMTKLSDDIHLHTHILILFFSKPDMERLGSEQTASHLMPPATRKSLHLAVCPLQSDTYMHTIYTCSCPEEQYLMASAYMYLPAEYIRAKTDMRTWSTVWSRLLPT